jgi:capsid assembly protease
MNSNLIQIADRVANGKWMLSDDAFEALSARVDSALKSDASIISKLTSVVTSLLEKKASTDYHNESLAEDVAPSGTQYAGIIPVVGVLVKGASEDLEKTLGLCNVDNISAALDEAIADSSVKSIILAFNSPGGETLGIDILARKIATLSEVKPIYGWCETQCASAAYWLASQCTTVCMTPDARIGNVGARLTLSYLANGVDKDGKTYEQFAGGKYKLLGTRIRPPTDEERNLLQADIDNTYIKFKSAVTSKRNIKDEDLQGLLYEGDKAVSLGYADLTSDTLTDYLNNKETNMSKLLTKVAVTEAPKAEATVSEVSAVVIKAEAEPKEEPKHEEAEGEEEMKHAKVSVYSMVNCPHCAKSFVLDSDEEKKAEEPAKEDSKPKEKADDDMPAEAKTELPKVEASLRQGFTMGELLGIRPQAQKNKFHAVWDEAVNERIQL